MNGDNSSIFPFKYKGVLGETLCSYFSFHDFCCYFLLGFE
jgi:hypothetical protein